MFSFCWNCFREMMIQLFGVWGLCNRVAELCYPELCYWYLVSGVVLPFLCEASRTDHKHDKKERSKVETKFNTVQKLALRLQQLKIKLYDRKFRLYLLWMKVCGGESHYLSSWDPFIVSYLPLWLQVQTKIKCLAVLLLPADSHI